jgi:hypothetical protein
MKSIKAYMPLLVLGLVTFLTGTLAAQSGQFSVDGAQVGVWNPCSPPFTKAVIVTGKIHIVYHQNGGHNVIHVNYEATGSEFDLVGGGLQARPDVPYTATLKADVQFDGSSSLPSYDVPYVASFVGQGASSFPMTGMIRVYVANGVPVSPGATFVSMNATCSN